MSLKKATLASLCLVSTVCCGCSNGATTTSKSTKTSSGSEVKSSASSSRHSATTSDSKNETEYPHAFDSCGEELTLAKEPKKIVSVGVVGLNNLVAAGAADKIIARAGEYGQPPASGIASQVKDIDVATDDPLTLESAAKYKADLIYGEGYKSTGASPQALQEKGIQASVPSTQCSYFYPGQETEPMTVKQIPQEIRRLGKALNTQEKANKAAAKLDKKLKGVSSGDKSSAVKTVAVVYHYDDTKDFYSFGAANMVDDMISTMGYKNATDPKYQYHKGPLAPDSFIASDPDVVIIAWGASGKDFKHSKKRLESVPGIKKMRAFREGNVVAMDNAATFPTPLTIAELQRVSREIAKVTDVG